MKLNPSLTAANTKWAVSKSTLVIMLDKPKPKLPKQKGIHPDVQRVSANRQTSFSGRGMYGKNGLFQGTLPTSSEDPLFFS